MTFPCLKNIPWYIFSQVAGMYTMRLVFRTELILAYWRFMV